ncbi:MAG: beta-propeller fold lactonase family protein [Leptospira sp.]|nr:beta-propeller fold lactonase family protein [Leptospira sp.]
MQLLNMASIRISFILSISLFAINCNPQKLNGFCDPNGNLFKQTLGLKFLIGEGAGFCGVNVIPLPVITSISTTSGIEGDSITIRGGNFSPGSRVVFAGNIQATITSFSNTEMSVKIPDNAKSGAIRVETFSGSALSQEVFTVYRYFVYIPAGTNMETYKFNPNTGSMTATTSSPIVSLLVGGFFSPNGKFMYGTINAGSNNVKSYIVNPATGTLTPTSIPVSSANNYPVYIAFHPSGRFLYTGNYNTVDVSAFSIDQTTGNLTKIGDFASSCGCSNLAQLQVTPDEKYLYVTGNSADTIVQFSINQSTGALSVIGNLSVAVGVDSVFVDPSSSFVYAVANTNFVVGTSINKNTGALTSLSGSPFAGTPGNFRGAMHPNGKYLYTVNIGGALLAKHDIASTGALSSPTTISFGTNLQFITIDPAGKFGFVNSGAGPNFYVVSIDQNNGTTTLINGNPFVTSATPGFISVTRIAQ